MPAVLPTLQRSPMPRQRLSSTERNVMECQAGSFRLDTRELDHLCPFFRFSRDISAELRRGEYHRYGASSARASTVAGISRPSAFAVLRLITSSYFVGACTGRSAG